MKNIIALLFFCIGMSVMAQGYKPTPITPPDDMPTTFMLITITSVDFYGTETLETGSISVGNANGHVYIQGLCHDYPEEWIVGTASEDKTTITFKQGQYQGEDFGLQLYFSGFIGDASKRCDFVLKRNASTGIMKNDESMSFAVYYYDDWNTTNKYTPMQRYKSVVITPTDKWEPAAPGAEPDQPDAPKEPVVVPEGVKFIDYTLYGTNFRTGAITHPAKLGFDGDDVYFGGFSNVALQTNTYVKGRRDGNRLIFPEEHFIVNYSGTHDMYLYGATYYLGDSDVFLDDLIFEYDASTDIYTCTNGILVSDGKFRETGNFSEYLQNVSLRGLNVGVHNIIDESSAQQKHSSSFYLPDGRSVKSPKSGLYICHGKKILVK